MESITIFKQNYTNVVSRTHDSTHESISFFISVFIIFSLLVTVKICIGITAKCKKRILHGKFIKLNTHYEGLNTDCPVCLELFVESNQYVTTLECYHSFHNTCLYPWIEESVATHHSNSFKCPMCNYKYFI